MGTAKGCEKLVIKNINENVEVDDGNKERGLRRSGRKE